MDDTSQDQDWRSEPRKSEDELCCCPVYVRMTQHQRAAVRILARERGESDAQFLRCLVDREARIQLGGEADAELAPSRKRSDAVLTIMNALCRQSRRRSD